MLFDLVKQINWLDLLGIVLFLRLIYIAGEKGFFVEFFKLLGVFCAVFLAFENFLPLADFFYQRWHFPLGILRASSFLLLAIFGYSIFIILRDLVLKFVKRAEKLQSWERILAVSLAIFRASVIFSLISMSLALSQIKTFRQANKEALTSAYFLPLSYNVHKFLLNKVLVNIYPSSGKNRVVEEAIENKQNET